MSVSLSMTKTKQVGVKRLVWDIEVSPNVVLAWRAGFKISVGHNAIVQERKIITIAYKWVGESNVTVLTWDKNQDDKAMILKFMEVANEADELIAHFGDSFDMPWFRGRCLIQGCPPIPQYKTIDTKAWASKYFYLNSNKLDYLAKVLGFEGKIETDFDMWRDITLHNDQKQLLKMARYNAEDVRQLEKVYLKLVNFCPVHTHAGVQSGLEKWTCPRTGSTKVKLSKRRVAASGLVKYQMQNTETGAFFSISQKAYDEYVKNKLQKVRRTATKGSR